MTPTAYVTHPLCNAHDTGPAHPEGRARLPGIDEAIRRDPALGSGALLSREARLATLADLLRVHPREHVERILKAAERAAGTGAIEWLDADTAVSGASFEAALASAGCALEAARLVARGEAQTAFAATRPPGHHATADEAMGFCLFNNVAVAARALQAEFDVERVLIADWDVHHGNGTQAIFWEDPSVYLLSLHLSPHYPGTGMPTERGDGRGVGTIRNVPLPAGTSAHEYRRQFHIALEWALEEFAPDFVLVSCGFDCLAGDPLGGLLLEPEDIHWLATELAQRTRGSAGGRVVALLEGGYVPERMGLAAVNLLRAFAGLPSVTGAELAPIAPSHG